MVDPYLANLDNLISLHNKVFDLNPALGKLYPVAIVVDGEFLIYDCDQEQTAFQFQRSAPVPMPIPIGVRAAFQLESYGGRIACVVTPDVFDTMEDYVTILHEFVHCYQYETCEQALKKELDIARQAQEKGNVMWEIEHPFPYSAKNFTIPYGVFLKALIEEDDQEILRTRKMLRVYLGLHDYEYMVWQEWKEGFARWIENLIKRKLKMVENKGGLQKPYSRVLFYAGGEAYIAYFSKRMPALTRELRGLFQKLYEI